MFLSPLVVTHQGIFIFWDCTDWRMISPIAAVEAGFNLLKGIYR